MKDETKSTVKTITIAIVLTTVVFFGLYKIDAANTASHSHDGGEQHSH